MKQLIGFIILFALVAFKNDDRQIDQFIKEWAPAAMKIDNECGIPASIQLAQAWYESNGGISDVGKASNNHFGIKAFPSWKGLVYTTKKGTKYRAYQTGLESWDDHAIFLHKHYIKAVGQDWKHWVKWCRGYGGGAEYWKVLGNIIEQNKLYLYDQKK
jgi:flagellum-specific peptidoglycan hydrolase FlgJ